ncbi:MAG: 4Fe-4S binding protein, partial [Proteobacteria bacterium]|nr:4Fe-4S binding protein [Pseudomonadota bacterium]
MPLDADAVRKACPGARVDTARHLCRAELDRFRAAVAAGVPMSVGCTQEAPLFAEIAEEMQASAAISFANIRETAGWSRAARQAGPKMAALLAAAAEPMPQTPFVEVASEGVVLICGRDESALEAAALLKDHLDITVLVTHARDVAPRRVSEFPVVKGSVRAATGSLGAFEVTVDGYATPAPSSRATLQFDAGRDGAVSHCDIILDLSGGPALFPAADLRDGYLRADPGDPAAVLRAVLKARDLVGTFDRPRYVTFSENLCAHSRSKIVGCRRCLDLCPTGAIAPAGDHVAIDARICAGCGQCAAVCPTGAASYALPPADALMRKLRTLLQVYRGAGGLAPVVLVHDEEHGGALIDALARHGDGLAANVLPFCVNEVTQVGLETIAAAFAYGAAALRFLTRARPRHDSAGLEATIALAQTIVGGLGFGAARVSAIAADDPDELAAALAAIAPGTPAPRPAAFAPVGGKRDVLRLALREMQRAAPAPVDVIALPQGAPFGRVDINVEGCTLCLACVSACPTGALGDDPERPTLRFSEDACVQCGLCKATCPEKVITLTAQLDFRAAMATALVLKEEEPFACIRCGTPFGVRSMIERITARLEGKHWMFKDSKARLDMLKMCDTCRITLVSEQ